MSPHVVTAARDAPLKRVANLMRGHTIGSVVVVDNGKPIGIVTTADLLELLGRGAIRPTPVSKRAPLNYRATHQAPPRIWRVVRHSERLGASSEKDACRLKSPRSEANCDARMNSSRRWGMNFATRCRS
jgi:hypothetical protein